MALINPIQLFILPFVFMVALPLALCAGFTTIIAFLILFLRLFVVYLDVGIETLRYLTVGDRQGRYIHSPIASRRSSPLVSPAAAGSAPSSPDGSSPRNRRRKRRAGSVGSGSISPLGSFDGVPLTPGMGLVRDFEGVGGWRLPTGDETDPAEEKAWESLNSRLELPDHHRHHMRSNSSSAMMLGTSGFGLYTKMSARNGSTSPEGLRMKTSTSPNSSRSRTPTRTRVGAFTSLDQDGYFPPYLAPVKKI